MTDSGNRKNPRPNGDHFFATVWPEIGAADSDSLRRRKFAVRAGHLAMGFMVAAAVGGSFLASPSDYSWARIIALCAGSLVYIIWNLIGTRGIVRLVLWETGIPPTVNSRVPHYGAVPYFGVQVALATLVYMVADLGRVPNLVWLALLPPVAYAVFQLEWRGITTVSVLMLAVLVMGFYRWHDLKFAAYAALAFSFAILFTIIFTLFAVHSEKARNEVQRLAGELSEANRQLREYAVQAEELSANRERNRIAREIHDSLGHYLTVAHVQLEAAQTLWTTDPNRAREAVAKAKSFTQEGLNDVRCSVASLRSSPLDNKSLADGLRELARTDNAVETAVEFQILGQPRQLPPPAELSLFRAGQEGLTNARKHSRAKQTKLVLDYREPGKVSLTVADNGIGAAQSAITAGFGLFGLRERAHLLGGEVRIETAPDHGFTLIFEVPA